MLKLSHPLFVALDIDDLAQALDLAEQVAPHVGGFKVGPRLLLRHGPQLVRDLAQLKPVFVDNKYFDIPNTMESAVEASFEAGATVVTVHAQAGREALERLAKLERECQEQRSFQILAVTILTSFTQSTLPSVSAAMTIPQQVLELSDLTLTSGIKGLVCSPEEVASLRARHPSAFLVVPGIRLPFQEAGDQKRIADPVSALRAGASALVVGRPIVEAKDPAAAAKHFADLLMSGAQP